MTFHYNIVIYYVAISVPRRNSGENHFFKAGKATNIEKLVRKINQKY